MDTVIQALLSIFLTSTLASCLARTPETGPLVMVRVEAQLVEFDSDPAHRAADDCTLAMAELIG